MSARDDIYVLRIAGVVDDDGDQIAYTTRPLAYTSPPTQVAALSGLSGTISQRCRVLEPVGSSTGMSVSLVYGAQYVDRITRQQIVPVRSSGGAVVRVVRSVLTGTAIYTQVEPDLTSGDLIVIGGELMEYTSWTALGSYADGAGYMTVVRGQGGTATQPIAVAGAGTVVLSQLASVVGQRYTLHRVPATSTSSGDEELVMRGFVDEIDPDGVSVSVALGSVMSRLRDRQYIPTAAADVDDGVEIVFTVTSDGITPATSGYGLAQIRIDALPEDTTGTPLLWLALARDGVEAELLMTGAWYTSTSGGVTTVRVGVAASSSALLMRTQRRTLSSSEAAVALSAPWRVTSVMVADQVSSAAASLGTLINTLLRGENGPIGRRGVLTASEVTTDLIARLDDASGVSSVSTPCYDGSERFVVPSMDGPTPMRDLLASMLAPWGCSLVARGDGRITAIDWLEPREAYGSLAYENEARAEWSRLRMSSESAVRAVTIDAVSESGQEIRRTLVSDYAAQIAQGGEHITVDAGMWGPLWPALQSRWYGLLTTYQAAAPTARLACSQDVSADVGDWVLVDSPTMHGPDGTRGIDGIAAVVTGRSQSLDSPGVTLDVALIGFGRDPNARRWAPALRVESNARGATDVITAADYYDDDEAAWFVAGDYVVLYDDVGNVVDATPREVTSVGSGTITCELFSTEPAAGDIVVLADYGDTPARSWAWLADSAGTLGSTPDPGHTWR